MADAINVPLAWTDAHHAKLPWYLGGQTNIDELVLLCRYHHVLTHEGHWTLRLDHTTGEVHVTRPDGTPHELGPSQPYRPMNADHPHRTQQPRRQANPDPPARHEARDGSGSGDPRDLPDAA
jgi:hypothetical protein